MTKRHWRDSIKALGSYIDPEQDEQVKKAKIDLDDRVAILMKLIQHKNKNKKSGGPIFDSELIELIDDFHKKYQTLYSLYEHLKVQVLENVHGKEENDKSSMSSSNSFHSSSELEQLDSVQQLEEVKNECSRLGKYLAEKEKELSTQKRKLEELEMVFKQREKEFSDILIKIEENEESLMMKSEDLMEKANDLQLEVDNLFFGKDILWQGGETMHRSKSESFLSKFDEESSDFLLKLEVLKVKFERGNTYIGKILEEKKGLEEKVKNFEILIKSKIFKDAELGRENEALHVRVSELEEKLNERNHDNFTLEAEYEFLEHRSYTHIKALEEEIMSKQEELNEKHQHSTELMMKKLEDHDKTKVDKELITTRNEMLSGLNSVETNFQEGYRQILNRIHMLCEKIRLTKDWEILKNEMIHEKESEIIGLKEKIKELENDMIEKEDGIFGLGEDKREAIRQLCAWVEYHRGHLKKILTDLHEFRSLGSSSS